MPTVTALMASVDAGTPTGLAGQYTSPGNIFVQDDLTPATAAGTVQNSLYGNHYAPPAGWASGIPAGSTINSVTLNVRRSGGTVNRHTEGLRLDSVANTQVANELTAGVSAAIATAAFSAWSTVPTLAQLQASTFRVRSRTARVVSQATTYSLYWIEIVVDYTPPGVQIDRSVGDAVDVADVGDRAQAFGRDEADAVAVADVPAAVLSGGEVQHDRTVPDEVVVADAPEQAASYARTEADTSEVADIPSRSLISVIARLASDAIPVADAPSRGVGYARTSANAAAVADSSGRTIAAARAVANAAAVADAPSRVLVGIISRLVADAVASGDAASRVVSFQRPQSSAAALADVASRTTAGIITRLVSNAAGVNDGVLVWVGFQATKRPLVTVTMLDAPSGKVEGLPVPGG